MIVVVSHLTGDVFQGLCRDLFPNEVAQWVEDSARHTWRDHNHSVSLVMISSLLLCSLLRSLLLLILLKKQ